MTISTDKIIAENWYGNVCHRTWTTHLSKAVTSRHICLARVCVVGKLGNSVLWLHGVTGCFLYDIMLEPIL